MSSHSTSRLTSVEKGFLAARIWWCFLTTLLRLKRAPLPLLMARLGDRSASADSRSIDPRRLGRIVQRVLRLGRWQARCLWSSLVLFQLLRRQGVEPQLVIGLPLVPKDKDAHAWVEIDGEDVGPPPGRSGHQELARYG
jgi:Transglutaminase-like superfamily